jgi:phage-related protein
VKAGLEPTDWKPFDEVGAGTREIRILDVKGTFRVMYVAKFAEAVYVLHCFQKKTHRVSGGVGVRSCLLLALPDRFHRRYPADALE